MSDDAAAMAGGPLGAAAAAAVFSCELSDRQPRRFSIFARATSSRAAVSCAKPLKVCACV